MTSLCAVSPIGKSLLALGSGTMTTCDHKTPFPIKPLMGGFVFEITARSHIGATTIEHQYTRPTVETKLKRSETTVKPWRAHCIPPLIRFQIRRRWTRGFPTQLSLVQGITCSCGRCCPAGSVGATPVPTSAVGVHCLQAFFYWFRQWPSRGSAV